MRARSELRSMLLKEQLERLVDEMVTRGVRYEDAQREFEKKFITHILAKPTATSARPPICSGCTAIPSAGRLPSTGSAAAEPASGRRATQLLRSAP